MSADEIIRALRENADWCGANEYEIPLCMGDNQWEAAGLIESMQSQLADYHHMSELVDGKMEENQRLRRINENLQEQLAASQHRERAAVEDIEKMMRICEKGSCHFCADGDCTNSPMCTPKWRGPREDGKGEAK